MSSSKENRRSQLPPESLTPADYGKLAECVRRVEGYRSCRRLFVSPAEVLWQVRINALLDQKELLMPAGGLKQGFSLFRPNTIPFNQLGYAVTHKGIEAFGRVLSRDELKGLDLGLIITDSEAVDREGGRLGDGLGYTDLAAGILWELGAMAAEARVFSVAAANRVVAEPLPVEPWDITLDGIITLEATEYFARTRATPTSIIWSALPQKRIRKIQPLWEIYCADNPRS